MSQPAPTVPLRSRGRPPKTEADQQSLKARIVDATLQAFAEQGYRALNVEHILVKANISRPTFYKYFRQLEQPLSIAAMQLNDDLLARIKQALSSSSDTISNAMAACDAYVDWGKSLGPVLQPLYSEFYERTSPISQFRLKTVAAIENMCFEALVQSGRPRPTPAMMGLFVSGIEFLAFQYLLHTDHGSAAYGETRMAMLRLLICCFGQSEDFRLLV
jgi:AcrR family transcriptional regulator